MTFDNQNQKDFVIAAIHQSPLTIPLGRLREAATHYLPLIAEIEQGSVADASADSEATV